MTTILNTETLSNVEKSIQLIRTELQGLQKDIENTAIADSVREPLETIIDGLKNNVIPLIANTQAGLYGLFGYLVQNLDSIPGKLAAISGALILNNVGNLPAYVPLSRCA